MPCRVDYVLPSERGETGQQGEQGEHLMPCKVQPTLADIERGKLNREAEELHEWLKTKLTDIYDPTLDETGLLCKEINGLGEVEFTNLMLSNINEPEARILLGWWEHHKVYDREYGRR